MKIWKLITVLAVAALLTGCDDPFEFRWEESPLESTLYSLDREELYTPSGYNLLERRAVVIESPTTEGRWDFALDRRDGAMYLLPPRSLNVIVDGRPSRAGIAPIPQTTFEDVREAPADTLLYTTREPVPLELGTVYVIRTFEQGGRFGQRCFFYGKVEPLEIDLERGALLFKHDVSPVCNDRRLVPPGS